MILAMLVRAHAYIWFITELTTGIQDSILEHFLFYLEKLENKLRASYLETRPCPAELYSLSLQTPNNADNLEHFTERKLQT